MPSVSALVLAPWGSLLLAAVRAQLSPLAEVIDDELPCAGPLGSLYRDEVAEILGGYPVRRGLILEGSERSEAGPLFFPYFSTLPLDEPTDRSRRIRRAVIMLQRYSGDPMPSLNVSRDFCDFLNPYVLSRGALPETVVVAPWCIEQYTDLPASEWWTSPDGTPDPAAPDARAVYWEQSRDYSNGKDSLYGGYSDFGAIDELITFLQKDEAGALPNLESITVMGFSGGGKVVAHWAILSDVLVPGKGRAKVQAIAGGANSYLYLDTYRPDDECMPAWSKMTRAGCGNFLIPSMSYCPKYNHYPEGLGHVAKANYTYVQSVAWDVLRYHRMVRTLPLKSLLFIVGTMDNCNCWDSGFRNADYCFHPGDVCSDSYPDVPYNHWCGIVGGSCAKDYQGYTRQQRLFNYAAYLKDFYRRRFGIHYECNVSLFTGGHDIHGFWDSHALMEFIFSSSQEQRPSPLIVS